MAVKSLKIKHEGLFEITSIQSELSKKSSNFNVHVGDILLTKLV